MTSTEQYIESLASLQYGDLGLLRQHALTGLDDSLEGFDLFSGIWWPLRERNKAAPRREVAWLIAKLYAYCPLPHTPGMHLAASLGSLQPGDEPERKSFRQRYDRMISSSLGEIEPHLQWALLTLKDHGKAVDWARLTDDLSVWERESKREQWTKAFLGLNSEGESDAD